LASGTYARERSESLSCRTAIADLMSAPIPLASPFGGGGKTAGFDGEGSRRTADCGLRERGGSEPPPYDADSNFHAKKDGLSTVLFISVRVSGHRHSSFFTFHSSLPFSLPFPPPYGADWMVE